MSPHERMRMMCVALAVLAVGCAAPPVRDIGVVEEGVRICPGPTTLEGIDVSTYQGTIDWTKVAATSRAFAIARVGDGLGMDARFDANWAGIKAAGMVRGVYQFFRPAKDPIAQADLLIAKIGALAPGDLPPVLDLEVTDSQTDAVIIDHVQKWLTHVQAALGKRPLIYTGNSFFTGLGNPDFTAYGLWVANWGVTCPSVPAPWTQFALWQYSDTGSVSGITGAVDLDKFNGTAGDLAALAGMTPAGDDGGTGPTSDGGGDALAVDLAPPGHDADPAGGSSSDGGVRPHGNDANGGCTFTAHRRRGGRDSAAALIALLLVAAAVARRLRRLAVAGPLPRDILP